MPKPRDVVLAAAGPPRRHTAALARLGPFLAGDNAKLRDAACALAVEILDDYGGGANPFLISGKLLPPLVAMARRGEAAALPPLAGITWILWREHAYPELAEPVELLVPICDKTATAKCLATDARKGLGKGATRAREGWTYRRMRFEIRLVHDDAKAAGDERELRERAGEMPKNMQMSPPFFGDEGDGDDAVTYSILRVSRDLRMLAAGQDPSGSRKKPFLEGNDLLARSARLLARATELVEPGIRSILARPPVPNRGTAEYTAWRFATWCEQALHLELAGDRKAARARMKAARDIYYTYGGSTFAQHYFADAERLKVPPFE